MNVNLNTVIKDDKNKVIMEQPEVKDEDGNIVKEGKELTVRTLLVRSLLAFSEQEKVPAEKKYEKYKMAMRLQDADSAINLKSEEISMLKITVGESFPNPLIVGRVWDILENEIQVTEA